MATQTLHFELVAPEKLLVSKPVAMVTVPGGEGVFGVLPGHAPMITTVKAGVIEIYGDNENTISDHIFVAGGFAEVTAERCTILAEEAMPISDLHQAQLEVHAKELSDELSTAKSPAEQADIETKMAVVSAKLAAISHKH
jgi:F-type H+-transporting ATPase subunit epsilon